MAKQIIDVQYVQVIDRLYVFETEPFEIQYGGDVTRVYVVDESYEGFKEINPDAPLKTFNPEAIQAGYPEWYEYVLSVVDSESNSELLAILYDAGLIANESYATLAEIRAINSSQFADAFATAATLTHFDEFEMFTGVKKLPDYMFQGCPNLESITFPESVYKLGKNVLAGCNSLDSVKVDGNNPKYYSPEGSNLIVDKTTRTIVAGCGNSTIPNDVYYIGDYAFANSDLTDIVIPKNIREIGDHAFDGCSALEYAEFESTNPPKIGSDVFDGVQPDFEIDVPEGSEDDYVDAWPEYADLIHGGEPQPHPEDLPDSEFGLESSDITITNDTMPVIIPLVNTHDLPVTYASSDTSVAVVDQSGNVTLSYNNGNANLTVAFAGSDEYKAKTLTYRVTVAIPQNLTDQELGLSSSSITIDDESDTVTLPLINIYNLPVTYTSSNQNVAMVSNNGNVTLTYANGSANITISFAGNAQYNAKTLTYAITVAIPQELSDAEFSWSASSATATQAGTFSGVTLTNTHGLAVAYSSSNTNVATIEPTYGHIMVTANGSTTISAVFAGNAQYKPKTVTYTLTVAIPQVLPDNEFGLESSDITITSNTMPVIIPLVNTHNLPVTYTSDDTSVATVNRNGNVTLTYDNGTAHISVAFAGNSEYQAKTVTYTVNVAIPQELSDQELGLSSEGISIDDSSETVTLPIVNVYNLPLTYTSDDTSIASVDGNGNVTLTYENGRANIYIEFAGNAQYASKGLIYTIDVDIEEPAVYTLKATVDLPNTNTGEFSNWFDDYYSHSIIVPGNARMKNHITKIRVDGVELSEIPADRKYVFKTPGKHIVEYAFDDPTTIYGQTSSSSASQSTYSHGVFNYYRKLSRTEHPESRDYWSNMCYHLCSIEVMEGVTKVERGAFYCYDSWKDNGEGDSYRVRSTAINDITFPSTITFIGGYLGGISLVSITIKATTPPQIAVFFKSTGQNSVKIFVPDESLSLYKSAWDDTKGRLCGINAGATKSGNIIIYYGSKAPATPTRNLLMSSNNNETTLFNLSGVETGNQDEELPLRIDSYISNIEIDGHKKYLFSNTYEFAYSTYSYNTVNYKFSYTGDDVPTYLFSYCDDIKSVTLTYGTDKINTYAFMMTPNLESVYLPETVTYIGTYAFYRDSGIPISYFDMTSYNPPVLGVNVFGEAGPEVIHVPEERVSYYKEAAGWSDYSENINPEPVQINYVTAAFNVTSTAQSFKLYNSGSNIKSIKVDGETLPSPVSTYQFDTTGRHEVKYELLDDTILPGGSNSNYRIFEGCPFDELYLPDSITTIGDSALTNLNITELELPKNVTTISNNLCADCDKLTSIVIRSEDSLSIGQGLLAFNNTIAGNLTLPQSLRSLGSLVYYSAKKPSYVSLLVTDIGSLKNNLAGGQIRTQINLPVRLVDENLNEIFDVVIPEDTSVANPNIAAYAFYNCSRVNTITFNNATPPTLGTGAFDNMTALTTIYVPKNSVDAYKTAWSNYANLIQAIPEIIHFADSTVKSLCVQNWDTNGDGELDTAEAAAVNSLGTVFKQNTTITSFNELSYFTGLTTISNRAFSGCSNITSITLPETITTIEADAFSESPKLTYINIPSGVTYIGAGTFFHCSTLNNITIPQGVTTIGQHTFNACFAFTEVILPENLTSIGNYAFETCTGLTEMTIPSYVTSIGNNAFHNCSYIETITCLATTPPTLKYNTLAGTTALTAIYVPAASVDVYKAATNWSNYANIIQAIPQVGYTINYSIKAIPNTDDPDYYQNIINEWAFTTYDEQTQESVFSKEDFDAVIDSISLDGVKINVETGEELRRSFTTEGLHNVELNLVGPTVPSNIFSSIAIYECHVGEGITTIGRSAFTEGWEQTTGGKLYLPSTITEFQDMPFTMCGAFKLYMAGSTPPVYNPETEGTNLFEGDYYIIFVPDAAVDTYKAHPTWAPYASNIRGLSAAKTNLSNVDFGFHIDDDHIQDYYDATINDPANNTSFGLDYFANTYSVEYILEYDTTMFTVDMWNSFTVIDTNRWTSASNTYTITVKFNGDDAFNAKTLTYNVTTVLPTS